MWPGCQLAAGLQAEIEGKNMILQLTKTVAASVLLLAPRIMVAQEPVSNTSKPAHREDRASTVSIVTEDLLSLAEYFRDLASQEQALAEGYEHIAALYKEAPPQGVGPAQATEMENQYMRLAKIKRRAANVNANLADYHSRLAELSRTHRHSNPPFSSFGK
jgi:hypothetical protein